MVDPLCFLLSVVCLITAVSFVLFPDPLSRLSAALNKTLVVLDHTLMRYRHFVALLLFGVSYLLFRLALLIPTVGH